MSPWTANREYPAQPNLPRPHGVGPSSQSVPSTSFAPIPPPGRPGVFSGIDLPPRRDDRRQEPPPEGSGNDRAPEAKEGYGPRSESDKEAEAMVVIDQTLPRGKRTAFTKGEIVKGYSLLAEKIVDVNRAIGGGGSGPYGEYTIYTSEKSAKAFVADCEGFIVLKASNGKQVEMSVKVRKNGGNYSNRNLSDLTVHLHFKLQGWAFTRITKTIITDAFLRIGVIVFKSNRSMIKLGDVSTGLKNDVLHVQARPADANFDTFRWPAQLMVLCKRERFQKEERPELLDFCFDQNDPKTAHMCLRRCHGFSQAHADKIGSGPDSVCKCTGDKPEHKRQRRESGPKKSFDELLAEEAVKESEPCSFFLLGKCRSVRIKSNKKIKKCGFHHDPSVDFSAIPCAHGTRKNGACRVSTDCGYLHPEPMLDAEFQEAVATAPPQSDEDTSGDLVSLL